MQTRKGSSRKWRGCVVNHALRRDARHSVACRYLCVWSRHELYSIFIIFPPQLGWCCEEAEGALLLLRTRVQVHKIDQGQL